MNKSIYNNSYDISGKSLYNIEQNNAASSTNISIDSLLNSLQSTVTNITNVTNTTTNPTNPITGDNPSYDIITSNTSIINTELYLGQIGSSYLLHIYKNTNTTIFGDITDNIIITTNQALNTEIGYTSIDIKVPYVSFLPEQLSSDTIPDNYFNIIDSKVKIDGPITVFKSVKTAFIEPIITTNYYDKYEFNYDIINKDENKYDKGLAFEYIKKTGINSNIKLGFMGYSTAYDRFVFYKDSKYGIYDGQDVVSLPIYSNGVDTGNTYNWNEYYISKNNNVSTGVEIDTIYTNTLSTITKTNNNTNTLTINCDNDYNLNMNGDININISNPNTINFPYGINITTSGEIVLNTNGLSTYFYMLTGNGTGTTELFIDNLSNRIIIETNYVYSLSCDIFAKIIGSDKECKLKLEALIVYEGTPIVKKFILYSSSMIFNMNIETIIINSITYLEIFGILNHSGIAKWAGNLCMSKISIN